MLTTTRAADSSADVRIGTRIWKAHCLPRVDIWWAVYRCGPRFEFLQFLQFLLAAAHCHHHCLPPTKPRIPYSSHKCARHEQGRCDGQFDKTCSDVSRRLQKAPDRDWEPLVMRCWQLGP